MDFLQKVRDKRKKLRDVLIDDEYSGLRDFLEELYPDNAHFIYELLQNAEDAAAKTTNFILSKDRLVFEHNGRAFDENDITAITNIGKGTKKNDPDKIGKFGIGFKAVFGYTETPQIWSPKYSFEIKELVIPYELTKKTDLGSNTRFEFPFNSGKKNAENAFAEINACLNEISPTTLLFLRNIRNISFEIHLGPSVVLSRKEITEFHVQITRKSEKALARSEFLRFTAPVDGVKSQFVAIAFELEKVKAQKEQKKSKKGAKPHSYRIIPAQPGRVAIFFPAKKEVSGLRFHLHAPFVPELSRASVKDTLVNKPLYEQIANLAANSLHKIRDMGLLTAEFLGVLPNSHDSLSSHYHVIRTVIQHEMKHKPLIPTKSGSYAPAEKLIQGKASYKNVFNNSDLKALFLEKAGALNWVIAALKSSEADRFLTDMEITELNSEKLFSVLNESIEEKNYWHFLIDEARRFQKWFFSKPAEWFQKFYAFLLKELEHEIRCKNFKGLKLVCLQNDVFSTPENCYFTGADSINDTAFPRVQPQCYSSGKNKDEQSDARSFLNKIGVREIGEIEQVTAILKSRYSSTDNKVTEKVHLQDIERFARLLEVDSKQADLFKNYRFLESEDGCWEIPQKLYIDSPFIQTRLNAYYSNIIEEGLSHKIISAKYLKIEIPEEKFIELLKMVGVAANLEFNAISCYKNPERRYLWSAPGRRNKNTETDIDFEIAGLEALLDKPSLELSELVWTTMCRANTEKLKAIFQNNRSNAPRETDSFIVCLLKSANWIPQGEGLFVTPAKAHSNLLPGGFSFDKNHEWLKAINFGAEIFALDDFVVNQSDLAWEYAQKAGFQNKEDLGRAQDFLKLPVEAQDKILLTYKNHSSVILPDKEPSNPELRSSRVFDQALAAYSKETEQRTRTIDIHLQEVKTETKEYLRQYYTNNDGQMICQICKTELPFKLENGEYYFESIKFLPGLAKQHYQNYLALCPNHAAMYTMVNNSADSIMENFSELKGNELQICMADQPASIHLNTTHSIDLKAILESDHAEDLKQESFTKVTEL